MKQRKGVNAMLILFCRCNLDAEHKDLLRAQVKERTGEDCLILDPDIVDIRQIQVENERAAP